MGLTLLCSLPLRTASSFPDWEASKEKNMSFKRIFYHKGTLTNKFEGAFMQKKLLRGTQESHILFYFGGERGIRTPGPVKINGFQDRRIRPLCHLSSDKSTALF